MSLSPNTLLGPYEVISPIGRGGMGEVYRARDTRLGRDVAVKVLLAELSADPDRLWRFQQEARTIAAINHPNLVQVYDTGLHDGLPYIVMEYLDGLPLRRRMDGRPLSPMAMLAIALQIARGLGAAHAKGVVHRDLKPENIFILRGDHVKILDFGLAKLVRPQGIEGGTHLSPMGSLGTRVGMVVGTAAYMSPEQVGGRGVDARSDLFSLGVLMWEMLSAERPFQGASAIETMHAILKEPPRAFPSGITIHHDLMLLIHRCLEKDPATRFQSVQDLILAMENLQFSSHLPAFPLRIPLLNPLRKSGRALVASTLVVLSLGGAYWAGRKHTTATIPSLHRLTYLRESVSAARFTPDGESFVMARGAPNGPHALWFGRLDGVRCIPMPATEGHRLLAVSRKGDLAMLQPGAKAGYGTLCQLSLTGGAPRQVLENVREADWTPQGELVVLRAGPHGRDCIEFPLGHVVYETQPFHLVENLRASPTGQEVLLLEHLGLGTGRLIIIDRRGNRRVLLEGMCDTALWDRAGKEIIYTLDCLEDRQEIRAIKRSGTGDRLLHSVQGRVRLMDMSPSGAVLMNHTLERTDMCIQRGDASEDQDYSWLHSTCVADLTRDGSTVLFAEAREGRSPGGAYIRKLGEPEATRLGDGDPLALSPDGKWALCKRIGQPTDLHLLPLGPGLPKNLDTRGVLTQWALFANASKVVIGGCTEDGTSLHAHILDLHANTFTTLPWPFPKDAFAAISPDGQKLALGPVEGTLLMLPLDGSPPWQIPGFGLGSHLLQWTDHPNEVFVLDSLTRLPASIQRFNVITGLSRPWRMLRPREDRHVQDLSYVSITPDGRTLAYSMNTIIASDLYLMDGWK